MVLDVEAVLGWRFRPTEHVFTERDAMLYALGVGLGSDPSDPTELRYVYERDLLVLPTLATVIGNPGEWYKDPRSGIDWRHVVHGEETLSLEGPLVPGRRIRNETRVVDVEDKGPGRGALVRLARELRDVETGATVARLASTLFCRNDGGFGEVSPRRTAPTFAGDVRPADASVTRHVSPRAGLIYRLSGDVNPLHVDPEAARSAGFDRPILHGLCTFAMATWDVLRLVGGEAPAAETLDSVAVRFKAPVLPGEELRTDLWRDGRDVWFRTFAGDGRLVLDAGHLVLREQTGHR